jgi:allophanate hydrolase subunit 1
MTGQLPARRLPCLEPAGLDAWMVRLFEAIDEANLPWLTALSRACEAAFGDLLVDLVPSYTTLLVVFDPLRLAPEEARHRLEICLAGLAPDEAAAEGDHGLFVCEVVAAHTFRDGDPLTHANTGWKYAG